MAPIKRKLLTGGSSSREQRNPDFRGTEEENAYITFSGLGITPNRPLQLNTLDERTRSLFADLLVLPILMLATPFNSTYLRQIFANLKCYDNSFVTYVNRQEMAFDLDDISFLLGVSRTGPRPYEIAKNQRFDWTDINMALRNVANPSHITEVEGLSWEARTIQHVLRTNLIPKAGDRIHITSLLTLCTYYSIMGIEFDIAHTVLMTLHAMNRNRDPNFRRKQNIGYGSVLSHLIEMRTGFTVEEDVPLIPFTSRDFHSLRRGREAQAPLQMEEEVEGEAATSHQRAQSHDSYSQQDDDPYMTQIGNLCTRVDELTFAQNEFMREYRQDQLDWRRRYDEDQAYIKDELAAIRRSFEKSD